MENKEQIQKSSLPAVVDLFEISINGETLRWTSGPRNGSVVELNGVPYYPLPIKATGFKSVNTGAMPTPKLTVSNIDSALIPVLAEYDDLIGAKFTRIRIFETYLDGGSDPDPDQEFPREVYTINSKTSQTRKSVSWSLSSTIDMDGIKLPRRQVLRDYCQSVYRTYDSTTGEFDYTQATCPYTGELCYNEKGTATGRSGDSCGKQISDCKKRFGDTAVLPFDGFPAVAKTDV